MRNIEKEIRTLQLHAVKADPGMSHFVNGNRFDTLNHKFHHKILVILSVTPFKLDQNKNRNRSIHEVQILRKERR